MAGLFFGYALNDLSESYDEIHLEIKQTAKTYLRLIEEKNSSGQQSVQGYLYSTHNVAMMYLSDDSNNALDRGMERLMAIKDRNPEAHLISIIDEKGVVLLSTDPKYLGKDISASPYIRSILHPFTAKFTADGVMNDPISGEFGMVASYPIYNKEQKPAGLAITNISYRQRGLPFYESLQLVDGISTYLLDNNSRVLMAYPGNEADLNKPFHFQLDPLKPEGELITHNNVEYWVIKRNLRFLGHSAVIAMSMPVLMEKWYTQRNRAVVGCLALYFGGLLLTWLTVRNSGLQRESMRNSRKLSIALKAAKACIWYWDGTHQRFELSVDVQGNSADGQNLTKKLEVGHLLHPDDQNRIDEALLQAIAHQEQVFNIEFQLMCEGKVRWMAGIGGITYDPKGKAVGGLGVCIDVSQIKLAEQSVCQARDEALAAKSKVEHISEARARFLAAASHDLRQPVQSLMLLLEVLKTQEVSTGVSKLIGNMESALEGLRLLLKSLQDVSRLDAGVVMPVIEPVDVGQMFSDLSAEYALRAEEKGIDLRIVPSTTTLSTDPVLLQRIIRNLLENALRYTTSGRILVGARNCKNWLRLTVMDTGIGIAPQNQSLIFEEFVQLGNSARDPTKGLGLGLAIVRRLVNLLGGHIEVQSELERGTNFTIWLPRT